MKSKAAKLIEMWMDQADSEIGEKSPMQELVQSVLKKANVPDEAYQLQDYGVSVNPDEEEQVLNALLAGGLRAVADGKGKIIITT